MRDYATLRSGATFIYMDELPSMDNNYIHYNVWNEITFHFIPKLQ